MAAKICWKLPEWEEVTLTTCRMQVPGGWLVRDEVWDYEKDIPRFSNLAYVPDPAFTWEWEKGGEEK